MEKYIGKFVNYKGSTHLITEVFEDCFRGMSFAFEPFADTMIVRYNQIIPFEEFNSCEMKTEEDVAFIKGILERSSKWKV